MQKKFLSQPWSFTLSLELGHCCFSTLSRAGREESRDPSRLIEQGPGNSHKAPCGFLACCMNDVLILQSVSGWICLKRFKELGSVPEWPWVLNSLLGWLSPHSTQERGAGLGAGLPGAKFLPTSAEQHLPTLLITSGCPLCVGVSSTWGGVCVLERRGHLFS